MDQFSFLNAAHTAYFAELYDQYLQHPDSVEPSWRAFFQGFDFGVKESQEEQELRPVPNSQAVQSNNANPSVAPVEFPEELKKEFKVVQLIDAYRTRGHLFTKTNPVRERRKYAPTLDIDNFGLSQADLEMTFSAGEILGLGKTTLKNIIDHLQKVY
mgnify:FL=1